jgi:hypothetical protein
LFRGQDRFTFFGVKGVALLKLPKQRLYVPSIQLPDIMQNTAAGGVQCPAVIGFNERMAGDQREIGRRGQLFSTVNGSTSFAFASPKDLALQ